MSCVRSWLAFVRFEGDLTSADLDTNAASQHAISRVSGGGASTVNLYTFIAHSRCHGLNLLDPESLPHILREHSARNERPSNDGAGVSNLDEDDGLLVHVVFSEIVRVKQILIAAPPTGDGRPGHCSCWVNRQDGVDLADVEDVKPEQEFELLEGEPGAVEYPVRIARFSSVSCLTLHFTAARPGSQFALWYLGFLGEARSIKREATEALTIGAENAASNMVDGVREKPTASHSAVR